MRRKNRESGYILVGVLLAVTILAVVGTSLVTLSTSSVKTSSAERDNQAVYYIAEAGLNHLANEFEQAVEEIYEKDHVKTEADFYSEIDKFNDLPVEYNIFEKVNDDKPKALLDIEKIDGETGLYKMTSTGYIGDEKRSVTQEVQVEWRDKYDEVESESPITPIINTPPFAVFTSGQFTMSNGTIIGDIGTISEEANAIDISSGGPTLNGKIYVPNGNEQIVSQAHYLNFEIDEIDSTCEIPSLPPFPDEFPDIPRGYSKPTDKSYGNQHNQTYYIKDRNLLISHWLLNNFTLDITENLEFNNILVSNAGFTLNVGNDSRNIVANNLKINGNGVMKIKEDVNMYIKDTLTMDNNTKLIFSGDKNLLVVDNLNLVNGNIDIEGSGKLTIYVKNNLKMVGRNINKESKVKDLEIYYAGSSKPEIGGDTKIYGNLYVKQADIEFGAGNRIQGMLLSGGKSIKIKGGSSNIAQMFFAPNAHVEFSGGGNLKGKVIAKNFTISGGGTVDFTAPDIDDDLFNPDLPDDSEGGSSDGSSGKGSEIIETGAKPSIFKKKVREEIN